MLKSINIIICSFLIMLILPNSAFAGYAYDSFFVEVNGHNYSYKNVPYTWSAPSGMTINHIVIRIENDANNQVIRLYGYDGSTWLKYGVLSNYYNNYDPSDPESFKALNGAAISYGESYDNGYNINVIYLPSGIAKVKFQDPSADFRYAHVELIVKRETASAEDINAAKNAATNAHTDAQAALNLLNGSSNGGKSLASTYDKANSANLHSYWARSYLDGSQNGGKSLAATYDAANAASGDADYIRLLQHMHVSHIQFQSHIVNHLP